MSGNIIFNKGQKVVDEIKSCLESNSSTPGQIQSLLDSLHKSINDLMASSKREITTVKREKAKLAADSLRSEFDLLVKHFSVYKKSALQAKLASEKSQLSFSTTNRNDLDSTMLDGQIGDKLHSSNTAVDSFIDQAKAAWTDLRQQGEYLKRTQRKMYDIANTLGLSSHVIKFIEKRARSDHWVLWIGIISSVIIMYAILQYIKK